MKDIAVTVDNLGKRFLIGETVRHDMLRESLMAALRAPYRYLRRWLSGEERRRRREDRELWALRNVSFEIERGSVVGIIGRNGAGKSTLLKILSRITEPSEGRAVLRGRVGSLLEVGTGFHDELTGRENVYLSGAILGMTKREIDASFDEIVQFAGVEKFIDTPVKRYSSGMRVRLGFAVAAFLRPEILIVDEVLAVGDVEFQKRCMGKMDELAGGGRTVLFVSHNMEAIARLTRRCLVLDSGKKVFDGEPGEAIAKYLGGGGRSTERTIFEAAPNATDAKITRVEVVTSQKGGVHEHGKSLSVHVDIYLPTALDGGRVAVQFLNREGRRVLVVWMFDSDKPLLRVSGRHRVTCRIPRLRLYQGDYTLNVYLADCGGSRIVEVLRNICPFSVTMGGQDRGAPWYPNLAVFLEDYTWDSGLLGGPDVAEAPQLTIRTGRRRP